MRRERITEDEIRAAVRASGQSDPALIDGVVLETDGSLSVIVGADRLMTLTGVREGT